MINCYFVGTNLVLLFLITTFLEFYFVERRIFNDYFENKKRVIDKSITLCDHGRIQTCNLLSRNQGLYSVKLRGRFCVCKDTSFFPSTKIFHRLFFV